MFTLTMFDIFIIFIFSVVNLSLFFFVYNRDKNKMITVNNKNHDNTVNLNYDDMLMLEKYFDDKMEMILERDINIQIIKDRMAGTTGISTDDINNLVVLEIDIIFSEIPIPLVDVFMAMYSKSQIKLMVTKKVLNKLTSYYKIFKSRNIK